MLAPLARGMDVLERAGGDGSSWGRVAAVKALCAVERKVLLATRGKADEDFRETPEKLQAVVLEKLAEAMPTLGSRTADFEVLPHCESAGGVMYNRISWRPVRAYIHACEVAALPAASESGALVLERLRQLWCKLHTKVISDDIAGIGAEPPCRHSACFAANMCVCKASGRTHLQTMKANLQKAFTIVMRDSAISAVVMMARCVVLLVGRTPEQLEDGAADLPAGAHGVGDGLNKMYETALWMHVGHLSKSPWRPAFLGLAGEEGVPLDALLGGHRDLLASSQPRSLYKALDLLAVDLRWGVAFFELAYSAALIGEFVPGRVQVVAAGPGSRAATYLIWDPVAEGKKSRRKVATWSFDFAELDSDSGDAGVVVLDEGAGSEVDEEGGGGVLEDGPAHALPGEGPNTDFAGDPFDDLLLADVPLAAAIDMCEEELVPMPPSGSSG